MNTGESDFRTRVSGSLSRRALLVGFLAALAGIAAGSAYATNGFNLIGAGAESMTMGGADIAVARDTTALASNPAGLTQIRHAAFDFFLSPAFELDVSHRDSFGSNEEIHNHYAITGGFGYAQRLGNSDFVAGLGVFTQGGSGFNYRDLDTAFGTRDDANAIFGIAKINPGIAWQVNDKFSLGVTPQIIYTQAKQSFFRHTSVFNAADPASSFFGSDLEHTRGFGYGYKVGAQYRVNDDVTLAMTYTSKTELPLEGGDLTLNFGAIGLGNVRYRDAELDGLAIPQEIGIGVAFRPIKPLLISLEANWLDWSDALRSSTLKASNPNNPAAPPTIRNSAPLNWRDQYVFAVGMAYDINEKTTLRAGYNYGNNPIPRETLNPLFSLIGQHHVALGVSRRLSPKWEFSTGIEYDLPETVTYTNPGLPFGPKATERNELVWVHLMLSRRW
jgi:long-chain fatty acid transport protein